MQAVSIETDADGRVVGRGAVSVFGERRAEQAEAITRQVDQTAICEVFGVAGGGGAVTLSTVPFPAIM